MERIFGSEHTQHTSPRPLNNFTLDDLRREAGEPFNEISTSVIVVSYKNGDEDLGQGTISFKGPENGFTGHMGWWMLRGTKSPAVDLNKSKVVFDHEDNSIIFICPSDKNENAGFKLNSDLCVTEFSSPK